MRPPERRWAAGRSVQKEPAAYSLKQGPRALQTPLLFVSCAAQAHKHWRLVYVYIEVMVAGT